MKLYYFDMYGRAEAMRMALHRYGVQFEDVRMTREQFGEMKASGKLEYGQVPALELDDGTMLCQSAAIWRYIELKFSDDSQDPMHAYQRENIACYFKDDFMGKYVMPMMKAADADKAAHSMTLANEGMPALYATISRKLGDRKWIVGDKFSTCDI